MEGSTLPNNFLPQATLFMEALVNWERSLPDLPWQSLGELAWQGKVAVFSVDMINGFCHEGALASPRVKSIIPDVVDIINRAYEIGVRDFIMAQDNHTPNTVEFANFPPHCQQGTSEAEMIPELAQLPFADRYQIVTKNALSAFHSTAMTRWLKEHRDLAAAIVVGNCTDLCIYQMAMHLKLYANEHDLPLHVIVPENAIQTYDMPVSTAEEIGGLPHDGDVLNLMFLYHMALNGVEIVRKMI